MGRACPAGSQRQRRCVDLLDTQQRQAGHYADDIHDRIQRANLVEMHLAGGDAMHLALGFGQQREDAQRALFQLGCERA